MTPRIITADEAKALLDGATPGPWSDERVGRAGDGSACSHEHQLCNSDGVAVAIITHDGAPGARANDRLIAAAPDLAATVIALNDRFGPRTQDGTDPRCVVEAGTDNVTYCARMAWMLDADDRKFRVGLRVPRHAEAYGAVVIDVKGGRFSFCDYCPFCGVYLATRKPNGAL